jgi:hypothetical protein
MLAPTKAFVVKNINGCALITVLTEIDTMNQIYVAKILELKLSKVSLNLQANVSKAIK